MSPDDAIRSLTDLVAGSDHVSVLLAAGEPEDPIVQRLTLLKRLVDSFRRIALKALPGPGDQAGGSDVVLREYEPGYKPDSYELLYVRLDEAEGIRAIISDVGAVGRAEMFAEADEVVDSLRFCAIVVERNARQRAVFLRGFSPKKELSRRAGFAAMFQRGAYDRISRKVFLFDEQVDCFAWQDYLFIWSVSQFQHIFQYFAEVREKAAATIAAVTALVPIANLQEFSDSCIGNSMMAVKLAQIAQKPYLAQLTMDDLRATIAEFKLSVDVVSDNGQEKLVFDGSPAKRWLILKLLDDAYLGSTMTKQKYEVNSKTRV